MSDEDPIKPMEDGPKSTDELEEEGNATQDSEVNKNISEDEA